MLMRVDHIDVRVPDLDAFVAFFEQVGLVVVRRISGERNSVEMALPGPDQVVFEIRAADVTRPTVDHVSFSTTDLVQAAADVADNGLLSLPEPRFLPATGKTVIDILDPWGARWQFTRVGGEEDQIQP